MISAVQPYNNNVNFQSRIHMDWHTAQYFESNSAESVTGEFKHQLQKLRHNKERDIVILKRNDMDEDNFTLDVITKDGRMGTSIVDNWKRTIRQKIDILGMYKEAKENLHEGPAGTLGFEALNI